MQEVKKVIAECVPVFLQDAFCLVVHITRKVSDPKGMPLVRPRFQVVFVVLVLVVKLLQHREVCSLWEGRERGGGRKKEEGELRQWGDGRRGMTGKIENDSGRMSGKGKEGGGGKRKEEGGGRRREGREERRQEKREGRKGKERERRMREKERWKRKGEQRVDKMRRRRTEEIWKLITCSSSRRV